MLPAARDTVLCVDLDGSLVATDLLAESLLQLVKRNPGYLFMLPLWLARGRARLKREVARRVRLDALLLPYHRDLVSWLRDEHARGRSIALATASDHELAARVADHLGVFDAIHASDGRLNLKGRAKAERLVERYGRGGFAYVGNAEADRHVWRQAESAIVVGDDALAARVALDTPVARRFPAVAGPAPPALLRATRPHQWVKNLLLFVPLVTSHRLADMAAAGASARAFVAMCLTSAAVYIVNDLFDLDADRAHANKRRRPFASGRASILHGVLLVPVLVALALALGATLPRDFALWLGAYLVATLAYSLRLKHIAVVDVLVLALLYTLRLIAGAAAIAVPFSAWLLAFSAFFFLSLALLKRFSELDAAIRAGPGSEPVRGYRPADRDLVGQFGTASGYLSILVMALYTNSRDVVALYADPVWLWGFCPLLLYWISRVWLAAYRGEMHEDPILYAVRQASSYVVVAGLGVCMFLAT